MGLMISYRLVDILTQEEDEWQGTAPTPDTHTLCGRLKMREGTLSKRIWGRAAPEKLCRVLGRAFSYDSPIAPTKVVTCRLRRSILLPTPPPALPTPGSGRRWEARLVRGGPSCGGKACLSKFSLSCTGECLCLYVSVSLGVSIFMCFGDQSFLDLNVKHSP